MSGQGEESRGKDREKLLINIQLSKGKRTLSAVTSGFFTGSGPQCISLQWIMLNKHLICIDLYAPFVLLALVVGSTSVM